MKNLLFLIFFAISGNVFSQLGFCEGSKGVPIFHEDFSSGSLPAGTTTYIPVSGDPYDGFYTISSTIGQQIGGWHSYLPNTTMSNGNALIVNADDNNAGLFFQREISGLCEATTYEFSAFLINIFNASRSICPNGEIPINVKFQILDQTGNIVLAEGSTGDIYSSVNPVWTQKALTFRSQAGQNKVILKMFNNGVGGCGNDLAIDDIIFRSCGDLTEVSSPNLSETFLEVCEPDAPVTVELTATPDNTVYTSHAFQWQESVDEVNWQDIAGETGMNFSASPISSTRYYRVKVAEDAVNLVTNLCSSVSESFAVIIVETPEAPVSLGDQDACEGDPVPSLEVVVESDESVRWYDSATGGVEVATGSAFVPPAEGTYYAEAKKTGFDCNPGPRTPVKLQIFSKPEVVDEERQLCLENQIKLDAGVGNFTYLWNTGATTQKISVGQPQNYSVIITNSNGCSSTKRFEVNAVDIAGIGNITSEGTSVIIELANAGEFQYSLDGNNFQESNIFQNISGGVYTAYIRDNEGCNTVSEEFPHIVMPQFITPNNDGINDRFELKGIEYFSSSEIRIFNRYGKILASGKGEGFSWDGTFSGKDLPSEDYWFHLSIEGFEPVKGHFTLKR